MTPLTIPQTTLDDVHLSLDYFSQVGLYSLYFHNCHNYWHGGHSLGSATATGHSSDSPIRVSFDVELEEKNHDREAIQ